MIMACPKCATASSFLIDCGLPHAGLRKRFTSMRRGRFNSISLRLPALCYSAGRFMPAC
jgi:hypothetical protein